MGMFYYVKSDKGNFIVQSTTQPEAVNVLRNKGCSFEWCEVQNVPEEISDKCFTTYVVGLLKKLQEKFQDFDFNFSDMNYPESFPVDNFEYNFPFIVNGKKFGFKIQLKDSLFGFNIHTLINEEQASGFTVVEAVNIDIMQDDVFEKSVDFINFYF